MDLKFNESTPSRPLGKRVTDASILKIDLKAYAAQLKQETTWEQKNKNAITVFKTANTTVVLLLLASGNLINPGNFDGTGLIHCLIISGSLKLNNEMETLVYKDGELAIIHEHVPFHAEALEETTLLLTMIK